MRKKYSDPLMFSSMVLASIPANPSQPGTSSPDDDWDDDDGGAKFSVNADPASASEDPVSIVSPAEDELETPAADPVSEVPSVLEELVPAESADSSPAGAAE